MGIFNLFSNKKAEAVNEEEQAKALALKKEKELEEVRKAHADLSWPTIQRINPVNIKDAEGGEAEDTVSPERKNEIGELIYLEDIPQDTISSLNGQELLFLLTTLESFNKTAPLPEYEKNFRKVYNEMLTRVRDAEYLYVLFDQNTKFPFIDQGSGNVFFEEDLANKAAALYNKQFRKIEVKKCPMVDPSDTSGRFNGFFDFLYYIGIENMVIDNGGYRARFKRSEIVAAPGAWNQNERGRGVNNPALNFAMLDFLEELRWPVRYEKREEILKAKEMRMLSLIRNAQYIMPMQTEGEVKTLEDGRVEVTADTKIKLPILKSKDDKQFVPVFTDGFEFGKTPLPKDWNAGVLRYHDIFRFLGDRDGIVLNPQGQNLVLTKDRMMALEAAAQQAAVMAQKNQVARETGKSADNAVTQALNQAMAKMREEDSNQ